MTRTDTFVKLYRSLLDWEWYHDDRCVRLLIHLLLNARYEAGRWRGLDLMPGQIPTSSVSLSEQLGWSRSAVNRTLDKLKSSGEVNTKSDSKWTLVTLVNWEKWQGSLTNAGHQTGQQPDSNRTAKRTKTGHQTGQQPDTCSHCLTGVSANSEHQTGQQPDTCSHCLTGVSANSEHQTGQQTGQQPDSNRTATGHTIRREEGYKGRREEEKKDHQLPSVIDDPSLFPDPGPSFEDWWSVYRKGSRKLSSEQWAKLSKQDREAAFFATRAYIDSRPDPRYRKDGERFLRHRTWEDPIIDNSTPKTANNGPHITKPSSLSEADKINAALAILQRNDAHHG